MGCRGLLLIAVAVLAGWPAAAADYRAPRTPDGAPDLNGQWNNATLTELERPEAFKTLVVPPAEAAAWEAKKRGKPPEIPDDTVGGAASEWWEMDVGLTRVRGQARSSVIVAPADGQIPFTAAAKAANKARAMRRKVDFDNPESRGLGERCLSTEASGPPMLNGGYNDNYKLVQTRDRIAILAEYMHDLRIVRLGAATHPPPNVRLWMGDSIGRWEGETLVIETTNFTPAEVGADDPRADMRVVERLTRTSPTELLYTFWIHNPSRLVQPYQGELVFNATKAPMFEFACHEGNYALVHELAGARQEEAAASTAAAQAGRSP